MKINKRYLFYIVLFVLVALFDSITHLGSWALELTTGLVDEGGGFPDDYVIAMVSAALLSYTLYSWQKNKGGDATRGNELFLAISAGIVLIFVAVMISMILAFSGWS